MQKVLNWVSTMPHVPDILRLFGVPYVHHVCPAVLECRISQMSSGVVTHTIFSFGRIRDLGVIFTSCSPPLENSRDVRSDL